MSDLKKAISEIFSKPSLKGKNNRTRKIDQAVEKTTQNLGWQFALISRKEVKAWRAYLIVFFVAGFFAALIIGAYNRWYVRSLAELPPVTMSIVTDTDLRKAGDTYTDQIVLDSAGQNIVAVQAIATYDPAKVEVVSIDNSTSAFPYEIKKEIDGVNGRIFVAVAKPTPGVNTTSGKIANVNLRALSDFAGSALTLKFNSAAAVDDSAAIFDDGQGTNMLSQVKKEFVSTSSRMLAWWKLDEGTGDKANDSSGWGITGTLTSMDPLTDWVTGKIGKALDFDGSNDYVAASDANFPSGNQPRTATLWFKTTKTLAAGNYTTLFSYGNRTTNQMFSLEFGTYGSTPNRLIASQFGNQVGIDATVNDGQWHFAAAVFDGTTWRLYLDATHENSKAMTTSTALSGQATIGGTGSGSYFMGQIDDVRFFNYALTKEQVMAIMNEAGTTPPPPSDTNPAIISNGSPTGTLIAGTTSATIRVMTNESATCKYGTTANTAFDSIANTFSSTGGTNHTSSLSGLTNGTSYDYYVRCKDAAGNANTTDYRVSFAVAAAPAGDTTPPVISSGSPSGTLKASTRSATLKVATNETANCKYSTVAGTAYASMPNTFSTTNSTVHSTKVGGLTSGTAYNYYVRCEDISNNANGSDYEISFSVAGESTSGDQTAPTISNPLPNGALPSGTTSATLSVQTNEAATCKYDTKLRSFNGMSWPFSTTGDTAHSSNVSVTSGNYKYYVRCKDASDNVTSGFVLIMFSVP